MTGTGADTRGTLYLLHFSEPYKHARHYSGYPRRRQGPRHGIRAGCPGADVEVTGQPAPYPNRDDPGRRVYFTLRITQTKGGRR